MRHSLSECVTLACLLEATAPKPGNVHRGADFDDLTYLDLALSGVAIAPALAEAAHRGVGAAILSAVRATRQVVQTNSNLGIVLLLAPLAAAKKCERMALAEVLATLTPNDAAAIWQAIALAQPGGLGKVDQQDILGPPPSDIVAAMRLAAERDLIAAQYSNNFEHVFEYVVPWLLEERTRCGTLTAAIVRTHVRLMAEFPDTLIARKSGREVAVKSSQIAQQVLAAGEADDEAYHVALANFDFWLRSAERKRNPGTTADLIAAGLFVLLREGLIVPPYR